MFAGRRCHLVETAAEPLCRRRKSWHLTQLCGQWPSPLYRSWEMPTAESQCHPHPWDGDVQRHQTRSQSAKAFNRVWGGKWFVLSLIPELLTVVLETSCTLGAWNLGLGEGNPAVERPGEVQPQTHGVILSLLLLLCPSRLMTIETGSTGANERVSTSEQPIISEEVIDS